MITFIPSGRLLNAKLQQKIYLLFIYYYIININMHDLFEWSVPVIPAKIMKQKPKLFQNIVIHTWLTAGAETMTDIL